MLSVFYYLQDFYRDFPFLRIAIYLLTSVAFITSSASKEWDHKVNCPSIRLEKLIASALRADCEAIL